jgi:hypothetical protein
MSEVFVNFQNFRIQEINVSRFFFCNLKKIHYFNSPISVIPGVNRKKIIFNLLTYSCYAKSEVAI